MQPPIRKATFIVRLWMNDNPVENNAWHGTVDYIGSGLPYSFQTIDEFVVWLRQELAKTEDKPES